MKNRATHHEHASRPRRVHQRLAVGLALCTSVALSGCVLTRVTAFKDQLCDHETNFALQIGDAVRLSMHHPVLHDTDVTWLAGAQPSERYSAGEVLKMRYVVKKQSAAPDSSFDIPIDLRFRQVDGTYRLEHGQIDRDFRSLMDSADLEDSLRRSCDAQINLLSRQLEIDLSDLDKSKLPSREEVVEILGSPLETSPAGDMISYEYHLDGAGRSSAHGRAVAWFDATGHELQRVNVQYRAYELDADLVANKAVVKVSL